MKLKYILACFLVLTSTIACNSQSGDNSDLTNNYVLITTAIRTSKESRSKFQDKFAAAADSFLSKDNPQVNINELKIVLEEARLENIKAEALIEAANEIDSTLRYKAITYKMLQLLDRHYNTVFPEAIRIMESSTQNKKEPIARIVLEAFAELKTIGKEVVNTGKSVVKKYDIKLKEVVGP